MAASIPRDAATSDLKVEEEEEGCEDVQDMNSDENVVLTSVKTPTYSMPGLDPIPTDQPDIINPKDLVPSVDENGVSYIPYESELQLPDIMELMKADLSEPYSIYTFRYFIHQWPQLCVLARYEEDCVGAIVCKLDLHRGAIRRGYIAMLAVHRDHRRKHIGSNLVKRAIGQMITDGCDEVVLEAEVSNKAALSLYANLGFVRDKYLHRYYLNGADAYRLKLWLTEASLD